MDSSLKYVRLKCNFTWVASVKNNHQQRFAHNSGQEHLSNIITVKQTWHNVFAFISLILREAAQQTLAYNMPNFINIRQTPENCLFIKPNEQRLQPQNICGQNKNYGF